MNGHRASEDIKAVKRRCVREILCGACSEPAVTTEQEVTLPSCLNDWGIRCRCMNCDAIGQIAQVDDGEQAMLVFRVEG